MMLISSSAASRATGRVVDSNVDGHQTPEVSCSYHHRKQPDSKRSGSAEGGAGGHPMRCQTPHEGLLQIAPRSGRLGGVA